MVTQIVSYYVKNTEQSAMEDNTLLNSMWHPAIPWILLD